MHRFFICLPLIFATSTAFAVSDPAIGDKAPDVELGVTSAGKSVKSADYAGQVVVVTFWASWCGPCKKELPIMENLQELGKGQIQVVAVNIEDREKFKKIARILKDQQMQFANDQHEVSQRAYHVKGIPHMIIIGRNGRILDVHTGYGEAAIPTIVDEINSALAATPQQPGDNH